MKKVKDLKKGDIVYTWDVFSEIKEYTVLQLAVCMSDANKYRVLIADDCNNTHCLTTQGETNVIKGALPATVYLDKELLQDKMSEIEQKIRKDRSIVCTTSSNPKTIAVEAHRRYPDCGEHGFGTGDYEYPEDHSIEREVFIEAAEWAIQKNIEDSIRWFRLQKEEIGLSWREDFEIRYREAMLKTL
jgi:hypothetical protein